MKQLGEIQLAEKSSEEIKELVAVVDKTVEKYENLRKTLRDLNFAIKEYDNSFEDAEIAQINLIEANEELNQENKNFNYNFEEEKEDSPLAEESFQEQLYSTIIKICSICFDEPELDEDGNPLGEKYNRENWKSLYSSAQEMLVNSFNRLEVIRLFLLEKEEDQVIQESTIESTEVSKKQTTFENLQTFKELISDLQKRIYNFAISNGASLPEITFLNNKIKNISEKKNGQNQLREITRSIDDSVNLKEQKFSSESMSQSSHPNTTHSTFHIIQTIVDEIDDLYKKILKSKEAIFAAKALFHNLQTSHFIIKEYTKHLLSVEEIRSEDYVEKLIMFFNESQKEIDALERFLVERTASVDEMCNFVSTNIIKKYNYPVDIKLDPSCELYEIEHAQQIERAIEILIENAVQALRESEVKKPKIVINIKEVNSDKISISFADNGLGIPEIVQPYIFSKTSMSTKGTSGQGLYFAHKAIANIGGELKLNRTGAGGTEFLVTLPIK